LTEKCKIRDDHGMHAPAQQQASQLHAEIYSQPDCWTTAVRDAPRYASVLPAPGERVAVVGCGTSLYIARAYAFLREEAGQGLTDAWPGSEARLHRDYDRILAITRSGTTTEILDVLDRYRAGGVRAKAPVTVITGTAGSPVLGLGDAIALAEFDETAVVQTRFATSVLALLRAHLGEDLTPVIAAARALLAQDPRAALDGVRAATQISFVGMGLGAALAEEAALKLRESTQSWVEAYHATEYRHGPISIAEPGRAVWALGPLVPGFARDVAATGAHLEHRDIDPMADLVRVHLLCLLRSADLGLDASSPRNLTRSIILDGHN
jgi:fructoselysine-6-P-deglycase FrlB-like protein